METYLFKMILCSAIFIGFYYLVLERQKSHQFKRFYLLSSILFSMLVPLTSITYGVQEKVGEQLVLIENQGENITPVIIEKTIFTVENIIYGIYILVTMVLLMRFFISLNALRKEIKEGKKLKKGNVTLVLNDDCGTAHSFWKFIFLNRKDFEEGKIDEKIIRHEELHLEQKHSFDVLLIEFLLVVFWFNPAFYFYKKTILTNHEFLADEHVLKYDGNVRSYQQLLLSELISERILFTNQFNLSNTKKRIKMMTTRNNKKSKFYNWLALPLAAMLFFAFAEKIPAKRINEPAKTSPQKIDSNTTNVVVKNSFTEDKDKIEKTLDSSNSEKTPVQTEKISENKIAEAQKGDVSEILLQEQTPAEYPGGMGLFRTKFAEKFDTSKMMNKEDLIKSVVYFEVDENGHLSNFRAEGSDLTFNEEAVRACREANGDTVWKPATENGKPVRSQFKLPLTMQFEKNPTPAK